MGRSKVLELLSKGDSQSDIAKTLQVDMSIISRDVYFLRQQAKDNIKRYILSQQTEDKREKIQALSLAKDCYSMKLELLTNATVVDDAIRLVYQKSREKPKPSTSSNENGKEESNEPDYYDEDEDQLQEEQEETGEVASTMTTNQVF